MTSVGRVQQAMILLKDRLRKLGEQSAAGAAGKSREMGSADPLAPVRALAQQRNRDEKETRKALVRALLADSFGPALATDLEFQQIADKVAEMLEDSEGGRELLGAALRELG